MEWQNHAMNITNIFYWPLAQNLVFD